MIQGLRASHGGFAGWLDAHHPRSKAEWVKLFKKTFRFTGGDDEWFASGYLRDEVGKVEGIRIVIIKQEDHREAESFYAAAESMRNSWISVMVQSMKLQAITQKMAIQLRQRR